MEAVLGQVEQLPALLAVSRSPLVRDWDPVTLDRALEWARYFQHLHDRFLARPQLREALGRRLRRSQPYPPLGFPALGRCPQLLGLALLENRALPPAACRRLLRSLLQPPGTGIGPEPRGVLQPPGTGIGPEPRGLELLARRKAAARLLALPRRPPPQHAGPEARLQAQAELQADARLQAEAELQAQAELQADARLQAEAELQADAQLLAEAEVRAEAELLLRRLREERQEGGEAAGQRRWLGRALEQLPRPRALAVVAAALALLPPAADSDGDGSSPDGHPASAAGDGCTAGLLLSWLLDNQERFSAFCLCLPGSRLAFLAGHYSQLSTSYLDLLTCWGSHLHYDPLQGRWVKSGLDKAEVSWEELKERFSRLCQGSAPLEEQTRAALKLLRTRDGDFRVCGLSVWTDLLMEVGY